MNFVKRAIAGVVRKPGKTAILLAIIFILGNIIAGAVSVLQAAGNAELTLRAKMSPVTGISVDSQKLSAMYSQNPELKIETLTSETIEKIGALPQVKYFDYSAFLSLETSSLKNYSHLEEIEDAGNQAMTFFSFRGVHYPEVIDIQQGLIRLVSGRVFNEQEIKNLTYVALISQDVADINNLSVGSVITLENNVFPENEVITEKYDFEIIGIFEPANQIPGSAAYNELANRMYTSNRVLNEAVAFQINEYEKVYPGEFEEFKNTNYSIIYVLNDPADLVPFREAVAALIPEYYMVMDNGTFDTVEASMNSLQGIASMVLYIAVGAAVATMSLLITLFLRDRRHEIGIYLSLGERKIKVAGQIFLEVAVVAVIAITLSLFSGNILSSAVSEQMLADQIIADQANETTAGGEYSGGYSIQDFRARGYQSGISTEELAASYAVSLDMITVLLFYAIGFATVCISVLMPIVYVTRLNPKKILMGGS